MLTFTQYLVEAAMDVDKLKHLEHAEDHIIHGGDEGLAHAADNLEDLHNMMTGKKSRSKVTVKYDGCIHQDTDILLPTGETRPIGKITSDWWLGQDLWVVGIDASGKACPSKVLDKQITQVPKVWVRIDTDHGPLLCTEDHQILTMRGWAEAGKLTSDDVLVSVDSL